jgi:hypothetical protein
MKYVVVEWEDATTHSAWTEEPHTANLARVRSVGMLLSRGAKETRLAMSLVDRSYGDVLVIPTNQVRKVTVLRGKEKKE